MSSAGNRSQPEQPDTPQRDPTDPTATPEWLKNKIYNTGGPESPMVIRLRREAKLTGQVKKEAADRAQLPTQAASHNSPAMRYRERMAAEAATAEQETKEPDARAEDGSPAETRQRPATEPELTITREHLRMQQQAQANNIFAGRKGGTQKAVDADIVQQICAKLSVATLQPQVHKANNKAGTVEELAKRLQEKLGDPYVNRLCAAAAHGGPKWTKTLDATKDQLQHGSHLEPALQSAVLYHWLKQASSTTVRQATQDAMRATMKAGPNNIQALAECCEDYGTPPEGMLTVGPMDSTPGATWLDPMKSNGYSNGWTWALFVLDRILAHQLAPEKTAIKARRRWEVLQDHQQQVIPSPMQQKQTERVRDHVARTRRAFDKMTEAYAREGMMGEFPTMATQVNSYMNSVRTDLMKATEDEIRDLQIDESDLTIGIVQAAADRAEQELTREYGWAPSRTRQQPAQQSQQQQQQGGAESGGDGTGRTRGKSRNARRRAARINAAAAAASPAETPTGAKAESEDWTPDEKAAIKRYCKENMKHLASVTVDEVKRSTLGIDGWKARVGTPMSVQQKKWWSDVGMPGMAKSAKQPSPGPAAPTTTPAAGQTVSGVAANIRYGSDDSTSDEPMTAAELLTDTDEDEWLVSGCPAQVTARNQAPCGCHCATDEGPCMGADSEDSDDIDEDGRCMACPLGEACFCECPACTSTVLGRAQCAHQGPRGDRCRKQRVQQPAEPLSDYNRYCVLYPEHPEDCECEACTPLTEGSRCQCGRHSGQWCTSELEDSEGPYCDECVFGSPTGCLNCSCSGCSRGCAFCRQHPCECKVTAQPSDQPTETKVSAAAAGVVRQKCICSLHKRKCRNTAQASGMCTSCEQNCRLVVPPWVQQMRHRTSDVAEAYMPTQDTLSAGMRQLSIGAPYATQGAASEEQQEDQTGYQFQNSTAPAHPTPASSDDDSKHEHAAQAHMAVGWKRWPEQKWSGATWLDTEHEPAAQAHMRVCWKRWRKQKWSPTGQGLPALSRQNRRNMSMSGSDSDEANFQRALRATRDCIGEGDSSQEDSPGDGESEDDFQQRCQMREADTDEQREAISLWWEAHRQGMQVTGVRRRIRAKTKLEQAADEQPEVKDMWMQDVESEAEEALVMDTSSSDSDMEQQQQAEEASCEWCSSTSCDGSCRDKPADRCSCKNCTHKATTDRKCSHCQQLTTSNGQLRKGCQCKCDGCTQGSVVAPRSHNNPLFGAAQEGDGDAQRATSKVFSCCASVNATSAQASPAMTVTHASVEAKRAAAAAFHVALDIAEACVEQRQQQQERNEMHGWAVTELDTVWRQARIQQRRVEVPMDGHCAYTAVSYGMHGHMDGYAQLRIDTAAYMKAEWQNIAPYMQRSKSKTMQAVKYGAHQYVNKGTRTTAPQWAWATEIELQCMAASQNIALTVFDPTGTQISQYGCGDKQVHILYEAQREHYTALSEIRAQTTPTPEQALSTQRRRAVTAAPAHVEANTTAEIGNELHVPIAWGHTFHTSIVCPQLDDGSATATEAEVEARLMLPCTQCTEWTAEEEERRAHTTVLRTLDSTSCFHTNLLCPELQDGHSYTVLKHAREAGGTKCRKCAQQEVQPTWTTPTPGPEVVTILHPGSANSLPTRTLRNWCLSAGIEASGDSTTLTTRLQEMEHAKQREILEAGARQRAAEMLNAALLQELGVSPEPTNDLMSQQEQMRIWDEWAAGAVEHDEHLNDSYSNHEHAESEDDSDVSMHGLEPPERATATEESQLIDARQKCSVAAATAKASTKAKCTTHVPKRKTPANIKRMGAYMASTTAGTRLTVAPDTCSETTFVSSATEDKSWRPADTPVNMVIKGLSESEMRATRQVLIPMRMRWGAEPVWIKAMVLDPRQMPDHVDVFLGTPDLERMKATIDVSQDRMELWDLRTVIDLEPPAVLMRRRKQRPLRVIDMCAGMSGALTAHMDAGYRIERWLAVENAQSVVESAGTDNITHSSVVDIMSHTAATLTAELGAPPDSCWAGPNCQTFSNANPGAKGMTSQGGELFEHVCKLVRDLKAAHPAMKYMIENVVPKGRIREETLEHWNNLTPERWVKVNAKWLGAATSRPRMVSTDMMDLTVVRRKTPVDPNLFLDGDASTTERVAPCIMTCNERTWNPYEVTRRHARAGSVNAEYRTEYANVKELLRTQGYNTSVIKAGTPKEVAGKIIGNAFHYQLARALITREAAPQKVAGFATAANDASRPQQQRGPFTHATKQENELHAMDDTQLAAWITHRLKNYKEMELPIKMRADSGAPAQVPPFKRFSAPIQRHAAVLAGLKQRFDRNHLKLVEYDAQQWISQMFVKFKGRIDPETLMEAFRALTDLRAVNSQIDYPKFWETMTNTLQQMIQSLPEWAEYYASEDIADAYEGMKVSTADAHTLTCVSPIPLPWATFTHEELKKWAGFSDEKIASLDMDAEAYLQWVGCPQGLAPAGPGFNCHIAHGLNTVFGLDEWTKLFLIYTDDLLIFGESEGHTAARQRLAAAALTALGKKLSSKCDRTIKTEGRHVGMVFTKGGVQLQPEAVESLRAVIRIAPKGKKQMQRLLGTIQQAMTAFEFDTQEVTWVADRIAVLSQASTAEPYRYTEEVKQALADLEKRIANAKRKLMNPDDMLTDDTCLVISSDASDEGIGAFLGIVKKADASTVTPEDLHDPAMFQLVATLQLVLSKDEKRQLTFEREVLGMYKAVDAWRSIIAKVLGRYPADGMRKLVLMMDSTTATSKWLTMGIPATLEHTSAKGHKYACMADEMAFLRALPVESKWIPGELMSFPDVLSRIELMMKEATAVRKATNSKVAAVAVRVHSYHPGTKQGPPGALPDGATVTHLRLGKDGTAKLREAQLTDNTRFHNVPMGTIAAVAMNEPGGDPALRSKASKYIGAVFYAITPPGETKPLLYTPAASVRQHELCKVTASQKVDETLHMVVVVPPGVAAKVTNSEPLYELDPDDTDAPDWMAAELDLRKDLIMMHHDHEHHMNTLTQTIRGVQAMGWWRTIRADVETHIESCADCLAERKALAEIGSGITTAQRGAVMQFDHYILDKDEAALAGVPAVLTMCDVASRRTEYESVDDVTAEETARVIYTRWIRYISTPAMIISDGHPSFTASTMTALRAVLGIAEHDIAAPRAKGKVAMVERKHRPLSEVLADGFAKADIQCRKDFDIYLAAAAIRVNQGAQPGRSTPYHLWHGQPPVHTRTMATQRPNTAVPETLSGQEQKLIDTIKRHTTEMMELEMIARDAVAKDNLAKRAANQPMVGYTKFKINVGEEASHKGAKVTLVSTSGRDGHAVTATVAASDGRTRRVRYDELRPVATPRPSRGLPRHARIGDVVFYETPTGGSTSATLAAGTLISQTADKMVIQKMEPNETQRVWLRVWIIDNRGNTKRAKDRPKDSAGPSTYEIASTSVMAHGRLKASGHMTDALQKTLKAMMLKK